MHLGLSYSHKFRHYSTDFPETLTFASRPEAHLFPVNLVNTDKINTDGADLIDPEVALYTVPWPFRANTPKCSSNRPATLPDLDFNGWYVEGSYFLTGESTRRLLQAAKWPLRSHLPDQQLLA